MSVFSQFFTTSSASGIHFADPRLMFRYFAQSNTLWLNDYASTTSFWLELAKHGATDATSWTADTYKTLLSVSGKGLVHNIIGPVMASTTDTSTVRITVDGVVTVITLPGSSGGGTNLRAVLGPVIDPYIFSTTDRMAYRVLGSDNFSTTDVFIGSGAVNGNLISLTNADALGTPMLKFDASILIELKISAGQANTGAFETSAGVAFRTI